MSEQERHVQQGEAWLEQLLSLSGLSAPVSGGASTVEGDDSCWLEVNAEELAPEQEQALVGERGQVLDSIQYLLNTTLNLGKSSAEQQPYTVELNGYRMQRRAELQEMAAAAARQVLETGEEYEILSLSSAERRQVHNFLKEYDELKTESRGQEPDRRLVVCRLVSAD
ncbi:MAG: RNA-binding protein [Kaiparowitsia implicata GSE-PSE-MK54-09C]|jgi:spoIIIJ-associated protein|nr:RNA-binding protein [Kaiparowitsia implicata GSE-PSE-MK54-09C]